MAFLKQVAVTLVVLVLAMGAFLRFDPNTGRYLLSQESPLPASLRPLVAFIAPSGEATSIGATPQRRGEPQPPLVVVDTATRESARDRLRAIGTGEAERSVAVYPDASGIVSQIGFAPGDTIARGDILATLDSDNERLAVDRARIALRAAEQQVERYRALSASAAITTVQIEDVERALETARLDLRAAEIALDRRNIVAPIDGRVGLTAIDTGTLVGNQTLIATIDDRDRLKIVFLAPEGFVPDLTVGLPVEARPTTRSGRSYEGEISALDSRIDEASRTLRVEALIENENDELRPGLSFSLELAFQGEEFLSVDPLSVQWERAGPYVWVVKNDAAQKAAIRIIERNVERVLVASDELAEGDAVVVEGIQSLREGVSVRVRANGPPRNVEPSEPIAATQPDGEPAADRRAAVRAEADAPAQVAR